MSSLIWATCICSMAQRPLGAIWRFEKDNDSRRTRYAVLGSFRSPGWETCSWESRRFLKVVAICCLRGRITRSVSDIAGSRLGLCRADELYASDEFGNRDFVCSSTVANGKTRRMIWCELGEPPPECLLAHKERLISAVSGTMMSSTGGNGGVVTFSRICRASM